MLPLEMVYAFDPVPPPPAEQEIEEEPTPDQDTSESLHEPASHRCSNSCTPGILLQPQTPAHW